jgi:hypothetical protein
LVDSYQLEPISTQNSQLVRRSTRVKEQQKQNL